MNIKQVIRSPAVYFIEQWADRSGHQIDQDKQSGEQMATCLLEVCLETSETKLAWPENLANPVDEVSVV